MKIYNTFDNKSQYKLKPIEEIVWHTIKGMLAEYYRNTDERAYNDGKHPFETIEITVKPSDVFDGTLTTYIITPSPIGLLEDVRHLFKKFLPQMQVVQGTYKPETKETVIIIKPFEIKLEHFSGMVLR